MLIALDRGDNENGIEIGTNAQSTAIRVVQIPLPDDVLLVFTKMVWRRDLAKHRCSEQSELQITRPDTMYYRY